MCLSSLEEIGNLREDYMWVSDGGRLWYGLTMLGIRFPLQFDTRYFFDLSTLNFGMLTDDPTFRGRRRNDLHCRG